MTSIFEPYDLRPNIVYTTRNSSTAAAMVQDNMGVLLVNDLSTRMWRFRVKVLPLEPEQRVTLGMAVSAVSTASPAVGAASSVRSGGWASRSRASPSRRRS